MKLYAETVLLRRRQQLSDLAVVAWVAGWCLLGRALYRTIEQLKSATTSAQEAGAGFAGRLDDVSRRVAKLPVVGDDLRRPFTGAADAGRALESAGVAAGSTVHSIALWAGILLALLPILWLTARYVPGRLLWMREAGAASRLRIDAEDLELFALRAVATAPFHELRRASPDPAGALARRDFSALADIEMRRLGLKSRA